VVQSVPCRCARSAAHRKKSQILTFLFLIEHRVNRTSAWKQSGKILITPFDVRVTTSPATNGAERKVAQQGTSYTDVGVGERKQPHQPDWAKFKGSAIIHKPYLAACNPADSHHDSRDILTTLKEQSVSRPTSAAYPPRNRASEQTLPTFLWVSIRHQSTSFPIQTRRTFKPCST